MFEPILKPTSIGNVVRDYYDGNTHVIICDDAYRGCSTEDQRRSWKKICVIASKAIHNQEILRRDGKNRDT